MRRGGLAGKTAGLLLFYLFVWLLKIENLIFGFHEISATLAYNYNNVDRLCWRIVIRTDIKQR